MWRRFKIGDEVVYVGNYSPELVDKMGIVVDFIPSNRVPNSPVNINVKWKGVKWEDNYMGVFPENLMTFRRKESWVL